MRTALILICTGAKYWRFIQPSVDSVKRFFPAAEILLFTDSPTAYGAARQVHAAHWGWPEVAMTRHARILSQRAWLAQFDYIFHMDIDQQLVKPFTDEIYADGIVVTLCPHFVGGPGTPETNPASTAYLPLDKIRQYVTASFQGGTTEAFLAMAEEITQHIDTDRQNGFLAVWHDESHLNRYVYDHPPAKILPATYCCPFPEQQNADTYITHFAKADAVSLPGYGRKG